MRREIGRVHVIPGHLRNQSRAQQRTQRGEHQTLIPLLGNVVEEDGAQQIARERRHAAALEPCRLAGAGQPDGQHYKAPRRPRRARRLRWDGGGRFRLCLHNQLTFRNWLAWRISSSCTSIGSDIALMSDIVQISSDNGRFLRCCLYLRVG